MTAARVTREAVDGLLDHSAAQARTLDELRSVIWFATDILLEVESLLRRYDLDSFVEARLFTAVRHFLLTCPLIDVDLHRLPMPERPGTPGDGACQEAAPSLGPGVDIVVDDEVSRVFDDLRVTEGEDGRS